MLAKVSRSLSLHITTAKNNKIPKRLGDRCDEDLMSSSKIQKTGSRRNFWTPLQLLDDNEIETEMDSDKNEQSKTESVSPIKVLTQNTESVLKLINSKGLSNYLIKKISLGLKIICESLDIHNQIVKILRENKCQFFTHDHKNKKPFKVVLRGLDYKTDIEVKRELTTLGLKCVDVKVVKKTFEKYVDTIYIVHFENGSVKLHELKKNVRALFRTIVTWDYQRKIKNKPVQCRKCQMFGHGEKGCNVTERCANCAQKHKTVDCKSNKVQCANCGDNHKATDPTCPTRSDYIEMREKLSNKNVRSQQPSHLNYNNNGNNFPQLNNKNCSLPNTQETIPNWRPTNLTNSHNIHNNNVAGNNSRRNVTYNNNNNVHNNDVHNNVQTNNTSLFSEEEFMELTMEMISRLSSCTTREQQFGVITQLAIKFVYCNVK